MIREMLLALALMVAGQWLFGPFEERTHKARLVARWAIYLGVAAILSARVGRPWSLVWILGLPLLGLSVHTVWCLKHGISPLRPEPRDRYYRLRGWSDAAGPGADET